jgi:hypothetical protein
MSHADACPAAAVYGRLLEWCPPLVWEPPWDFLPADPDCRGPVVDPARALAALRREFDDASLAGAGVLEGTRFGAARLNPVLTNPVGALLALRDGPEQAPYEVLTARGCLSGCALPVLLVTRDARTEAAVAQNRALFVSSRIREVALLRALGLAATLTTGLHRLTWGQVQAVAALLGEPVIADIVPPSTEGSPACPGGEGESFPGARTGEATLSLARRLVLLGWDLWALRLQVPPLLPRTLARLKDVRRFLRVDLFGVVVWRPTDEARENFQFRSSLRDVALVRELVLEGTDPWDPFDSFSCQGAPSDGEPARAPPTVATAHADLLATLGENRPQGRSPEFARDLVRAYDALVQRDLVAPLQAWALASDDPAFRNAGMELATVAGLLHRLSPRLHELTARQLERPDGRDGDFLPRDLLAQYLQLNNRFAILLKNLGQWRERR